VAGAAPARGACALNRLFDLDITLQRGDFRCALRLQSAARCIALVGPSGCGKSSLLHAIAGLLRPQRGVIHIDGQTLFDSASGIHQPPHRRRIGYVFQDGRLFPHRDVAGNLRYGMPRRADASAGPQWDEVVALLGLAPLLQRRVQGLSGGETQRVALGRALLAQPRLLLLDEPLSMLDFDRRDELLPYLLGVRERFGLPMVYVSHYPEEVQRMAEEVFRLPQREPDAAAG
jgi:molybdate transport system ATP-binding protein